MNAYCSQHFLNAELCGSSECRVCALRAEVDRLRGLLREARELLPSLFAGASSTTSDRQSRLCQRISAALAGQPECICTPTVKRADCPVHGEFCPHGHVKGTHECGADQPSEVPFIPLPPCPHPDVAVAQGICYCCGAVVTADNQGAVK